MASPSSSSSPLPSSSNRNDPIVIGSDTEEEEEEEEVMQLGRAAKRVKREEGCVGEESNWKGKGKAMEEQGLIGIATGNGDAESSSDVRTKAEPGAVEATTTGIPGLSREDRKELDRARRERQRQRRREAGLKSGSEDEAEGEGNKTNLQARKSSQALAASAGLSVASKAMSGLDKGQGTKVALRRILAGDRFWQGTVKRSFNQWTGDGVPFEDFILPTTRSNPNGLTHAVIASYVYDFEWLSELLPSAASAQPVRNAGPPPEITYVTLNNTSGAQPPGVYQMAIPGWVVIMLKGFGREYTCQHMKFLMLFYPDRMRLCILTGNLIKYDWESLENAAYVQDFPILPGAQKDATSEAFSQLRSILRSLEVPNGHAAVRLLPRFDLSKGPRLVASLASQSAVSGWPTIDKLGLGRMGVLARELLGKPVGNGGVFLEAQGSSMGSYSQRWLQQFHLLASAVPSSALPLPKSSDAALRAYNKAIKKPFALTSTFPSSTSDWPPVQIIFPTKQFVERESAAGPAGGGCHFGKPAVFEKWKGLCRKAIAARHSGVLMHQKGVLALDHARLAGEDQNVKMTDVVGWVYMGSANFTMNAWGNISTSASGEVQMTSNNWELGIMLPVTRYDLTQEADLNTPARSAICWRRPTEPYGPADVPWSARDSI